MNEKEYSLIEEMLPLLVSGGTGDFTDAEIESANKFKKFIDHLPGGFLIYRSDDREEIIYANKAIISMFACDTLEEFKSFTGNSFKGIVYYEDLECVENSIKQQISTSNDNLDYVEYRIIDKKGTIRFVEDYGHFIRTKVGDIFYVFITDATEKINQKNNERALILQEKDEKEQKLKNLIEEYDKERILIRQEHLQRLEVIEGLSVNYDSILYVDLDADMVLPYRLSERLTKQFGRKLQVRHYGWFVKDFVKCWVHPEDKQRINAILSPEYIRKTLAGNRTYYANFKCVQNSETKYLQLRIVHVKNSRHISQIVIGSRNIEEEIVQEMKNKALLETALKDSKLAYIAKNTFLSNMSHDMRTPLNALFGYLELAKKNADDKQTLERYLDKINAAGKQLLDLVDKVLQISYLESKDFQLDEKLYSIKTLTQEVYKEILPSANEKNIDVLFEFKNILHDEIYTDRDKLQQILLNIAGNAVKYTKNGGKINLTVEEKLSSSSEFATFRFIMNDTGVGIAKESLKSIFEPFEREYNSTHSGVFGSGLGLTIAKHIIDFMGGTITAESEVGVGSTFTIMLSFRLGEKPEETQSGDDVTDFLKNKKILLVEDNEINLEIETEILQDLGLIIESAENGKIAVEKVKNSSPGEYLFVLMDIQMPVMDGRQATEEIRKLEDPALAEIPIIALSANAFESDKRMSVKNGMNAHLTKPIDIPALLDAVKKVIMNK